MKKWKSMILVISIAGIITSNGIMINASNVSDLKSKQNQIQSEVKKAKDILEDTTVQKNTVMQQVLELDIQLDQTESELDMITNELEKTTTRLDEAEVELADAEEKREMQYESLKKRMRYIYENGNVGYLDVVFEASDFSDFINRFEYVNRIIEYDDNLVNDLVETENLIAERIEEIVLKKAEEEILMTQQTEKKHALEENINQKNSIVFALTKEEQTYFQQVSDLEKSGKEVETLIRAAEAKEMATRAASSRKSASQPVEAVTYNGILGWPVPGRTNVSSGYGSRSSPISGKKEFHTGIDIPAPTGTNIMAAESGTVISAKYMNGYGYTVTISHAGGVSTLYAHNSKLLVSAGETVERGQVISKAGSTGYSTGPHLHFEVRENGGHVNPWNYLK